jgi:hypothetical protein
VVLIATACMKSPGSSEGTAAADSTGMDDRQEESGPRFPVYAQVDSLFLINDHEFRVQIKQFDLTELAAMRGDTMSRPTFTCSIKIFDGHREAVFSDSVHRDSWGYAGKIVPIEAYEIALPQLQYEGDEIILSFPVYEEQANDAISGCIAFNIRTKLPRYFWKESSMEY